MLYVAVDPGTTTGLAYHDGTEFYTLAMPADKVLPFINLLNTKSAISAIAVERFATAGKLSKYGLQTIDLVGQIKGYCFAHDITVYLFAPQSRRAWMGKKLETPHQMDALAHLKHLLEEVNESVH